MVSFGEAVSRCYVRKIFNYQDRAPRSEFWFSALFNLLICIVLEVVAFSIGAASMDGYGYNSTGSGIALMLIGLCVCIFALWSFLASIAVWVRRLHDINFRGWWCLLILVPFGAVILLIMAMFRGTIGPNRFGPDPLAPQNLQNPPFDLNFRN